MSKKTSWSVGVHPFNIKPSSNILIDQSNPHFTNLLHSFGLFSTLPDLLILHIFEQFDLPTLLIIAQTCKAAFAFSLYDNLWKNVALASPLELRFGNGTWRSAVFSMFRNLPKAEIDLTGIYSDVLYTPWKCAALSLTSLVSPHTHRNIEKRNNLSVEEFIERYEKPGIPVIITDIVCKWKASKWTMQSLVDSYPTATFRAEALDITLKLYNDYAKSTQDDQPFYLFDAHFGETTTMANDYNIPPYFQDHFSKLSNRPNYRWLIIGPERAGSTFHKDPNATSAWNSIICGRKKWLLLPPHITPPGVFPSEDGSTVTTPLSLAEWYLSYYDQLPPETLECVCEQGETMFIPSGWWHMVVNLEFSIALTQNYVCDRNVEKVAAFCRDKSEQVSGYCGDLYGEMVRCGLVERKERKERWEEIKSGSFRFGFEMQANKEE